MRNMIAKRKYDKAFNQRSAYRKKVLRWWKSKAGRDYWREHVHGKGAVEHFRKHNKRQQGKCAICKRKMKRKYQDHNHKTEVLRGLLCIRCNTALHFIENDSWLKAATKYLRRWKHGR